MRILNTHATTVTMYPLIAYVDHILAGLPDGLFANQKYQLG
jgi:hypothetical protein